MRGPRGCNTTRGQLALNNGLTRYKLHLCLGGRDSSGSIVLEGGALHTMLADSCRWQTALVVHCADGAEASLEVALFKVTSSLTAGRKTS